MGICRHDPIFFKMFLLLFNHLSSVQIIFNFNPLIGQYLYPPFLSNSRGKKSPFWDFHDNRRNGTFRDCVCVFFFLFLRLSRRYQGIIPDKYQLSAFFPKIPYKCILDLMLLDYGSLLCSGLLA